MSLFVNLISTFDDSGLKKADGKVGETEGKLTGFGKAAGAAFLAAGVAAAGFAATLTVDAIGAASDFNETVSKSNVIFGDAAKAVQDFATKAGSSLGQTKQQALDAASTFATFGKAAGLSGTDLAKFSTDFTVLASDLASFNNTTPEEAINAIGAALRGESEPLRSYGVLLDDASMRQKAFELGLISTTKEALTPQNKVLAAQALIYEQTKDAQGDFARTSDGMANSQRILTAEFENFKIGLGERLLPIITNLLGFIKDNFLPILSTLGGTIGNTLAPAFDGFSKFISETLMPNMIVMGKWFMETLVPALTDAVVPILDGLKNAFGSIKTAIEDNEPALITIRDFLMGFATFIAENVAPVVGTVLGGAFTFVGNAIGAAIKVIAKIIEAISGMVTFFNKTSTTIRDIFDKIGDFITKPFKMAFKAVAEFWNDTLGKFKIKLPDWLPIIGGKEFGFPKLPVPALAKGGIVTKPTLALIGEAGPEAVVPLGKANNMGMGGITINVSGALDPESVARQIETILKRSRLRAGAYS